MATKRKPTEQIQIGLRLQERLRARLEQSAKRNDGSLNREIVHRLERSFDRQDLLVEALTLGYGEFVAGLLLAVGCAMEEAGKLGAFAGSPRASGGRNWADVPFAKHEAIRAATLVLQAFDPKASAPDEPILPDPLASTVFPDVIENLGGRVADRIVDAIKGDAPPELRSWASTVRQLLRQEGETIE